MPLICGSFKNIDKIALKSYGKKMTNFKLKIFDALILKNKPPTTKKGLWKERHFAKNISMKRFLYY